MALVLKHQTKEQFMTKFRQRYRDSENEITLAMASKLLDLNDDGDVTDQEIKASFGFSTPELMTFKTKLSSYRTSFRLTRSAQGE